MIIYLVLRISKPYLRFYIAFMFNEKTDWNKNIEKPRLLFYQFGSFMILISFYKFSENLGLDSIEDVINNLASWLLFITGSVICYSTWTKWFKKTFIPRAKAKLKQANNFNLSISEQQLKSLFNNLIKYDFIDEEKNSFASFRNVFKEDWNNHDDSIYFKFKGPEVKEFYDLLDQNFPSNSLKLINFIEKSKVIRKSNGELYKYNTITKARNRGLESKYSKELKAVFSQL